MTAPDGEGATVVLVRHAETEWSRSGRHTGHSDIALTDSGRSAATALAARLLGWRFELVLVSPSARARETCELCGLGAQAQVRTDLLEWDYGAYEGLTTPQIERERPDWSLWRDGCPDGESAAHVGMRADRVIAELRSLTGVAAVFSHGHLLRVLGARWIDLAPERGGGLGLSTGAICLLGHEHRSPILARWNDTGVSQPSDGPHGGGARLEPGEDHLLE
jgi:broad specificity phosphatase PhoE